MKNKTIKDEKDLKFYDLCWKVLKAVSYTSFFDYYKKQLVDKIDEAMLPDLKLQIDPNDKIKSTFSNTMADSESRDALIEDLKVQIASICLVCAQYQIELNDTLSAFDQVILNMQECEDGVAFPFARLDTSVTREVSNYFEQHLAGDIAP